MMTVFHCVRAIARHDKADPPRANVSLSKSPSAVRSGAKSAVRSGSNPQSAASRIRSPQRVEIRPSALPDHAPPHSTRGMCSRYAPTLLRYRPGSPRATFDAVIVQLAAALALAGGPTSVPPQPAPPPVKVYHGRRHQLDASIPRLEGGITVDGVLDEPQWQSAAVLTGFSQYSPADGIAAEDSIEVLVWYSATAINFGIRAFEVHGAVHSTLATRDKIDSDDYVQLLIGTFNDGRQAMLFGVNPLGVQQDGIITETGILRGGSGFGSAGGVREAPDLNPDFVFRSKGRITDYGY
jgi:hypothetical protein